MAVTLLYCFTNTGRHYLTFAAPWTMEESGRDGTQCRYVLVLGSYAAQLT